MCLVYGMVQLVNSTPKETDPRVKVRWGGAQSGGLCWQGVEDEWT